MKVCLVLVRNDLHVPSLGALLYSTQRHRTHTGYVYYDDNTVGNLLFFPTMIIDVESTTDNIFSFRTIGCTLMDRIIDYAEPCLSVTRLTKNPLSLYSVDIPIPTQHPTKYPSPSPLSMPPSKHPRPALLATPPKLYSIYPSGIANMHLTDMPDIQPYNTASQSETRQAFDPLKLHRIFGCCRLCNPKHITSTAENATLIDTGKTPTTTGAFATTPKANEGKSKIYHCHFLDKVHMDIVYNNCTSMGGYRYKLLLVDVSTR